MEDQQDRFAERLKRIEARKGARPPAPPQMGDLPPVPPEFPPYGPDGVPPSGPSGGNIGVLRMTLILLILVTMIGVGGFHVADRLGKAPTRVADASGEADSPQVAEIPEEALAVLTFKVERPTDDSKAPPARLIDRGWELRPGLVANADMAEIALTDIVSGYDPEKPDLVPGGVEMFDANTECTLRNPAPGEVVHNVRIEHGMGPTDIHVVSSAIMADALAGHVEGVTSGQQRHYLLGKTASGRMNRVDVFVTDTSGPVYLVLQNVSGNTLWNVHRGSGVRIAHVALIGNTSGAILPGDIELEALRIGDFVKAHEFGDYDTIEPCMVRPFRSPEPDWPAVTEAARGNQLLVNLLHTSTTGFASFNDWYTKTMGFDANTNLVGVEGAAHVLVGPRPAGPLGYNRIEWNTAKLVRTDRVYLGDAALIEAHAALLNAAAGGDARDIDPAAMERRTQ